MPKIRNVLWATIGSYIVLCLVVSGSNLLAAAMDRPMGDPIMFLNWPIKVIVWVGEVYSRLQMMT